MNKKFLSLILVLALSASLTACGSSDTTEKTDGTDTGDTAETVTLKVAASPTPHAEILEQVKPILAEQGIDLVITEYGDYVVPNTAVDEGDEDANYFQHTPYLEQFNEENGTDLVSAGKIHYEPMGIYAGQSDSLENIPDGAVIAVPNDATNEGRALLLLQDLGIITLSEDAGLEATKNDIVDNPHNIDLQEMEAAMLPQTIDEVDFSIINSNYALDAGLNPTTDALATEDAQSDAAQAYANIIAVKEGNENDPAIQALYAALTSDTIKDFINNTYDGAVVPIF